MRYEVILIGPGTAHPAACCLEDDELTIIQEVGNPDAWWPADEFFYMEDITEFSTADIDSDFSPFAVEFNALPKEQRNDIIATLFARVIPEDLFRDLVLRMNLEEEACQIIDLVKEHHALLPTV